MLGGRSPESAEKLLIQFANRPPPARIRLILPLHSVPLQYMPACFEIYGSPICACALACGPGDDDLTSNEMVYRKFNHAMPLESGRAWVYRAMLQVQIECSPAFH